MPAFTKRKLTESSVHVNYSELVYVHSSFLKMLNLAYDPKIEEVHVHLCYHACYYSTTDLFSFKGTVFWK